MSRRLSFAYYCSGHGYGHATRVSAVAAHLCSLPDAPSVTIVSSAPQLVFQDSLKTGAKYRYTFIDPVIVQPLAYYVDRRKSVDDLRDFLDSKDQKVDEEAKWLKENHIDCVLSDAAFLACLAANAANIPAVLITNFTFDSVYSYLSAPITDSPPTPTPLPSTSLPLDPSNNCHCLPLSKLNQNSNLIDNPIPPSELSPLVAALHTGYRHADLLYLLPGHIPIPSFHINPALPSYEWVNPTTNRFYPEVMHTLEQNPTLPPLLPPIGGLGRQQRRLRQVRQAPLVVRHPSSDIYTSAGRARLLNSIGVSEHLQRNPETKILVVSFGGQVFKKPSSRATSRSASPLPGADSGKSISEGIHNSPVRDPSKRKSVRQNLGRNDTGSWCESESGSVNLPGTPGDEFGIDVPVVAAESVTSADDTHTQTNYTHENDIYPSEDRQRYSLDSALHLPSPPSRLATPHHIWVPGAPPSDKPQPQYNDIARHPSLLRRRRIDVVGDMDTGKGVEVLLTDATPSFEQKEWVPENVMVKTIQYSKLQTSSESASEVDVVEDSYSEFEEEDLPVPRMLPDETWIAIVCGASKPNEGEDEEMMPDNFFTAPKDVYMPDLMALADVMLGKLGYGTVSECVDACTPFVYVPRPLFVEEHGLRRYLSSHGVGIELSRSAYEAGDWAPSIEEAYERGKADKAKKRVEGDTGVRAIEMARMAKGLVEWAGERRRVQGDE